MDTLWLTLIIILVDFIFVIIGTLFWYAIWVKPYGCSIPNKKIGNIQTTFNSKNFGMVASQLNQKIKEFDKEYIISSCGFEAYAFLIFQRHSIFLLFVIFMLSFLFSLASAIINISELKAIEDFTVSVFLNQILFQNKALNNDYSSLFHIICMGLVIVTLIRFLTVLKGELKDLYFSRFDKMSRDKNYMWLSSRTLHISGIAPFERNINLLKTKLNFFLSNQNISDLGSVVDISFIPDYKNLLELEIQKEEINDLKKLIPYNVGKFYRNCCFPKYFSSEEETNKKLNEIEEQINSECEKEILSSGHAFVTFTTLKSAFICLQAFREDTIKNFRLKLKEIKDSRTINNNNSFKAFRDEDLIAEQNELQLNSVDILVDQMIEPSDIIWTNIGGDRGLNLYRRITCTLLLFLIMIFMTTPTVLFSTIKSIVYSEDFELDWIHHPIIDFLKTYSPPFTILCLNQFLIILIDFLCLFEKHYTYSRLQASIFKKTYFYFVLNMLIIPAIAISTAHSLYDVLFGNKDFTFSQIYETIGNMYVADKGMFFVNLIIQNGVFSYIFYLLRFDELVVNSYSSFITFYNRHFTNNGKAYHRSEAETFQYGYFYAQMLTVLSIAIVFSSTIPFVTIAAIAYFYLRHVTDFLSLLMVHRSEMDSNGMLVSNIFIIYRLILC